MKLLILCVLCAFACQIFSGCNFSASYTDPKTGTTYYGGTKKVADPK